MYWCDKIGDSQLTVLVVVGLLGFHSLSSRPVNSELIAEQGELNMPAYPRSELIKQDRVGGYYVTTLCASCVYHLVHFFDCIIRKIQQFPCVIEQRSSCFCSSELSKSFVSFILLYFLFRLIEFYACLELEFVIEK